LAQNLSRGQKQRLALASTLIQEAAAYVLDEPTLGLDLQSQNDLIARIKELPTVLITTHDPVLAWEVADRFIVLKGGEVREIAVRSDLAAKGVHDPETLRNWLLEVYR
jgi:ABC-2 type transport system ATP-binding protein